MENGKYLVRKATPLDAEKLRDVMLVISDDMEIDIARPLIKKIAEDPQKYLMVIYDTETDILCGSLLGVIFEDICSSGQPILLVENVAVLPSYQRQGIGRMMMKEIEAWGKENNCHYEMLVSGNNRERAHKFYKNNGFEEVKGYKKYL